MEKNCSKSFSNASNYSDIKEKIIKQLNTLKRFNMEPPRAIPKKHFVSEEENNCEKINLTPQDRISNTDWWKCGYECKPMMIFAESFRLLVKLKSWNVRRASRHSTFMGNYPTISHMS